MNMIPFEKRDICCPYCVGKMKLIITDQYNKKLPDAFAGIFKCERCMVISFVDNLNNKMSVCTREQIEAMKSIMYPKLKSEFIMRRPDRKKTNA